MVKRFLTRWLLLLLLITNCLAYANRPSPTILLPAEKAFVLSVSKASPTEMTAEWKIAPGYHLYKSRLQFQILPSSDYQLGHIHLPQGISKSDDILGNYEIYEKNLKVLIPITKVGKGSNLVLQISYQGCKGSVSCYAPVTKKISMDLNIPSNNQDIAPPAPANVFSALFAHHGIFWILLSFLGFGVLLSFTPCILPMIPILSSIILGQKKASISRSFILSLIYVVSAALAFAVAGFFTALAGHSVQAMLQNKWVIIFTAVIFIILALSLFGLFELQVPSFIRNRVHHLTQKQKGGTYTGAAIMGVLSSLVVSPCISAPLVGALLYISDKGNALLGAATLFVLGIGMGLPLIAVGTLGGKLFIKAGPWMKAVKIFFGVIMLLMAFWIFFRLWPATPNTAQPDGFVTVYNTAQLNQQLNAAKIEHKPALIDFYATWCTACKELEYKTFKNAQVKNELKNFVLIRADVTANDQNTNAMQQQFSVFAPPTVIFLNSDGKVVEPASVYGYVPPNIFIKSIDQIK